MGDVIRTVSARRRASAHRFAILLLLAVAVSGGVDARDNPPPPGHTREVAVVRTATPPHIDGVPSEDVWATAPVATDFWISEFSQAPAERTEVRVLVDDKALYVAFTCYDSQPDRIRANETRRDGPIGLDDHVMLELDPYHNHRLVSRFSVSARGTQADAMAGGRGRKITWKGDWQAAATRTDTGWTAEIAIPFDILDFNTSATVFGVNFVRYQARTQEWSRWADQTTRNLAEEAGHIVDLQLPGASRPAQLMLMPYASGGVNTVNRAGVVQGATGSVGFDGRIQGAGGLTGVMTARPDFSHVEDAVLDVGFNYNEKYRPDARPFFQEGAGFFGSRAYFYSGRIPDFLAGVKTFGKFGDSNGGLMALGNVGGRRDYIATFGHEIDATINAGAIFVGSEREEFSNRLFAVQSNGRLWRNVSFAVDVAATSTEGRDGDGTRAAFSLGYRGPHLQVSASADRTDALFFPANGFIAADILGTQAATAQVAYGRGFGTGWLRRADGSVSFGQRTTLDGLLQRRDLSIYGSVSTRSNVEISAGTSRGPYRPRAGGDSWLDTTFNDRFSTVSISQYSRSGRVGYAMTYSQGVFSDVDYKDLAPSVWVKPTRQSSLSYSYERASYYDVSQQHVLSFSWDVTPEQGISGRWVQYGEPYYRLAYRRVVRRGFDLFAVYNREPFRSDQFTAKVVWTMNVRSPRNAKQP